MKKFFLVIWILTIFLNLSKAQWVPAVNNNIPTGGNINSIITSGTNLFAGTGGGGVFISTDSRVMQGSFTPTFSRNRA